jgi:hypothetical protein
VRRRRAEPPRLWPARRRQPQLRALRAAELAQQSDPGPVSALAALPFVCRGADGALLLHPAAAAAASEQWMPFIEERGDWGVRLTLRGAASGAPARCPRCAAPLASRPGSGGGGGGAPPLLAFPCGHAFHEVCVPERGCVACARDSCPAQLPEIR